MRQYRRAGIAAHIERIGEESIAARLACMPVIEREAYLLCFVDGLSIDEIAHELALPRAKVIAYLVRALSTLMR